MNEYIKCVKYGSAMEKNEILSSEAKKGWNPDKYYICPPYTWKAETTHSEGIVVNTTGWEKGLEGGFIENE